MTREDAIKTLYELRRETNDTWYEEVYNMAIEALQREEAEEKGYCHRIKPKEYLKNDAIKPSNDVINRADAMGAVQDHFNADGFKGYDDGQKMMDRIKALPSAEQVISKLNNPCDSLLTDESNGSKEHKSKLDLISRQDVIEALSRSSVYAWSIEQDQTAHDWALNIIKALPSADAIHSGGVFVPNMEMPKACDYCLFHDSGWSWCKAKDKYCGDGKCPLIAVRGERREP